MHDNELMYSHLTPQSIKLLLKTNQKLIEGFSQKILGIKSL